MASTKKTVIKIGSDVADAKNGIQSITKELNKLNKSTPIKTLSMFGAALSGVKAGLDMATKSVKAVNAAIKETTELYKKQEKAEIQLETAAKNNPYLDGVAVKQLKDYAGELQKVSTVGDEELLPMMARLASAGRTQNEIQQIMSTALDVSASGMMSLDSAVTALNKTYSGSVGLIGNQISGLKGLTAEQLKNGEAVKIVADKFKGMSAETTKATGSSEQLKNAWGDLKETFGQPFERAMSPMRSFFTELVSGWASARKKKQEYNDAKKADVEGNASLEQKQVLLEAKKEFLENMEKAHVFDVNDFYLDENNKVFHKSGNQLKDSTKASVIRDAIEAQKEVQRLTEEIKQMQKAEEEAEHAAKVEEEVAQIKNAVSASKEHIDAMKRKAELSKEDTESIEFQSEILSSMQRDYVALAESSASYTKEAKAEARNQMDLMEKQIATQAAKVETLKAEKLAREENSKAQEEAVKNAQKEADEIEKAVNALLNPDTEGNSLVKQIRDTIDNLEELKKEFADNSKEAQALDEKIAKLQELLGQEKEIQFAENIAEATEKLNSIKDVFADIGDAAGKMFSAASDLIESETQRQLESVENMYKSGMISQKEYENRKEKINRDAAQKKHKIDLWNWGQSIIQAGLDTASAVLKNLSAYPQPLGGIMAGISAAAGAVQLGLIMANKPTPPKFASGGIVQGNSYSGDRVVANVNSGEMILNATQQRQLWETANGMGARGGVFLNIHNSASNLVRATPQVDGNTINLMIDARVTESLRNGRYDAALEEGEFNRDGVFYGI